MSESSNMFINVDDIKNKHLYELKILTDKSMSNHISFEAEALWGLFGLLFNNSSHLTLCVRCNIPLLKQEVCSCNRCKKSDLCKKCLATCGINSHHKVHSECLTKCEMCNIKMCYSCSTFKRPDSMTRVCINCYENLQHLSDTKCSNCAKDLEQTHNLKCVKCNKSFCTQCADTYQSSGVCPIPAFMLCWSCGSNIPK